MNKSKNKKSWLEKLNEADMKQEAKLKVQNRKRKTASRATTDQQLDTELPKLSKKLLVGLTFLLPIAAWLLGAAINPSGWASSDPSIIYLTFAILPIYGWIVSVPLLAVIIYLLVTKKTYAALMFVFLTSFVGALFIFQTTVSANESEFTG